MVFCLCLCRLIPRVRVHLPVGTACGSFITQHVNALGQFVHSIDFTVTEMSRLPIVSFDSMLSFFQLNLRSGPCARAVHGLGGRTAGAGVQRRRAPRLAFAAGPGNYSLVVTQQVEMWLPQPDTSCVPLVHDVQLAPASAAAFVRGVEPPGARDVPPDRPLTIVVLLSAAPFAADGTPCVDLT